MNTVRAIRKPSRRLATSLSPLALAAATLLASGGATAQDSYGYIGLGGGQTRGHLDEQRITNRVTTGPGAAGPFTLGTDRRDAGYKLFGGYQLNRYLAFEGGYFNLGRQGFNINTATGGSLVGDVRTQGANFDVVGSLPLTDNLSALARAGVVYARTRTGFNSAGGVTLNDARPSERGANPKVGLGLQYALSDNFLLRGEAERYRINDAVGGHGRVNLYSVSLVIPFGRAPAPAPRAAYTPPPVVQAAPAPAPVVVAQAPVPVQVAPVAPPVVLRRVTYSAEPMFMFDSVGMRPEGQAMLDGFVAELAGVNYDTINVEGHTDRLGSPEYNQALSIRRAQAVKDYLVRVKGLDPARVTTVGKGETAPITTPQTCPGNSARAEVIACLQPDRRVEIEVSGTR